MGLTMWFGRLNKKKKVLYSVVTVIVIILIGTISWLTITGKIKISADVATSTYPNLPISAPATVEVQQGQTVQFTVSNWYKQALAATPQSLCFWVGDNQHGTIFEMIKPETVASRIDSNPSSTSASTYLERSGDNVIVRVKGLQAGATGQIIFGVPSQCRAAWENSNIKNSLTNTGNPIIVNIKVTSSTVSSSCTASPSVIYIPAGRTIEVIPSSLSGDWSNYFATSDLYERWGKGTGTASDPWRVAIKATKPGKASPLIRCQNGSTTKLNIEIVPEGTCAVKPSTIFIPVGRTIEVIPTSLAGNWSQYFSTSNIIERWGLGSESLSDPWRIGIKGTAPGSTQATIKCSDGQTTTLDIEVVPQGTCAVKPSNITVGVGETKEVIPSSLSGDWSNSFVTSDVYERWGLGSTATSDPWRIAVKGTKIGTSQATIKCSDGQTTTLGINVVENSGEGLEFSYTPNVWNIKTYNFTPKVNPIYDLFSFMGSEIPIRAYTYAGSGTAYAENRSPMPGEGFWFLSGQSSPARIPLDRIEEYQGTTAPINGSVAMVGNPTQKSAKWSDVTITINSQTMSIIEAARQEKPLVRGIFIYQSGAGKYDSYYAPAYTNYISAGGKSLEALMNLSLAPGDGVWIALNPSYTSATLNFPQ